MVDASKQSTEAAGEDASVERLSQAVRFMTISAHLHEEEIRNAFRQFLDVLVDSYPALASRATIDRDDPWRLVYEIEGSDRALDPILILAHYDVVPIEHGTADEWTHEPFGGEVDDGYVWGRGSLDDKSVLIAILEAAERTLAGGAELRRGLVLAFGGDEELSGRKGAARTARLMRERGRRFHFTLDEGAVIARGMLPGVSRPVALIGIAEKGHVNVELVASTAGGHAAMPPRHTALGRLALAIARVESHPFPLRLGYTLREFFRAIAGHAAFPLRLLFRAPRLFAPLLARALAASPTTAALVRTTQAVTVAHASDAPNVLPQRACAVVNVRILPGTRVSDVVRHYRRLLRRHGVEVRVHDEDDAHEPIEPSALSHPGYRIVTEALAELHDAAAAPYLVTGSTDSKWYAPLSNGVYRFLPIELDAEEIARIHGTDERISIENYRRLIAFYEKIIDRGCIRG